MNYTYMLRCDDNTIYTGYTNDLNKRMKSHFSDDKEHAKYTKTHRPKKLEIAWQTKEKSNACSLEYYIKTLTKSEKEDLIITGKISRYLSGKVDSRHFKKAKIEEIVNKEYL